MVLEQRVFRPTHIQLPEEASRVVGGQVGGQGPKAFERRAIKTIRIESFSVVFLSEILLVLGPQA